MTVKVLPGDCLDVLAGLPAESVDSVVTDPPYHFGTIVKRFGDDDAVPAKSNGATGVYRRASAGFMGKKWDGGDIAFRPETWAAVARVLKPGGYLLAFGAPRNAHRLICAIEDAGFEIRDRIVELIEADTAVVAFLASLSPEQVNTFARCLDDSAFGPELLWIFGTGFPKSHNLDGDWKGWGTALKPAYEPIVVARKPLVGTVAENVLAHGTGALNIDGCRVEGAFTSGWSKSGSKASENVAMSGRNYERPPKPDAEGRWPANLIHDGSEEVVGAFPNAPGQQGALTGDEPSPTFSGAVYGKMARSRASTPRGDTGSAARFFYSAKAGKADRAGSKHPTVKPVALMRYLCRLVTPPGGTVLDPFAGSGTTGQAAIEEGFNAILIEREAEYLADIDRRLLACADLFTEVA